MRNYISANQAAIEGSLGPDGPAELRHATDHAEQAINAWKDAEPRIWGHIISRIYRLLNWKAFLEHLMGGLAGADRAAELFLSGGIERWEKEGRIGPIEVKELRTLVSSGEGQIAMHHLGAHLVTSVAVAVPIPGVRSLARFAWTVAFWVRDRRRRFSRLLKKEV